MSGIILLFFIIALCYNNAERAKRKGLNPLAYGVLTGVLFFAFEVLGVFLVIALFSPDLLKIPVTAANDPAFKQAFTEKLTQFFEGNYLRELTIELFAIGGYLLVRYIIEQRPEKQSNSGVENASS